MENFSFVFTIFFMLLGPIKLIEPFRQLTAEADGRFKRDAALFAALIATAICAVVALVGEPLVGKYRISLDGLRLAGGLVLLLSALGIMFPRAQSPRPPSGKTTPLQVAISLATPIIVPPAGVAAILIFTMLRPARPGMGSAVALALAIVMVLDFLAMRFNDRAIGTPGLMIVLRVLGGVLIFMQVALAVETMVGGLRGLGIVTR